MWILIVFFVLFVIMVGLIVFDFIWSRKNKKKKQKDNEEVEKNTKYY